ncbi:MAG: VWA domain-containing protein, partial [Acidobacteria bacterium]|nr:VWA domain-containing protein [Acidobacteriota bacterium]
MLIRSSFGFFPKPLIVAVALCTAITAQTDQSQSKQNKDRQSQDPLVRIETELVQIDLVVADKNGKLVRDLKREDFELFEDGKKQQITHFAAGTATKPATWLRAERPPQARENKTTVTTTEVRGGRYIVIAVDDFHLAAENLMIAKRTLQRFINEQLVAGDQIAVVTTSGNVGLFQQFTSDREVLERAISRLSVQNRTVTSSSDVPRISDYQAELIDLGNREALELAALEIMRLENVAPPPPPGGRGGGGRPGGPGGQSPFGGVSARERAEEQAKSKARSIVAQNAHYTRATLDILDSTIRSLRQLTGRKMLVLLSDGFFLGGSSSSQFFDIRRITDAATRSGVVIYSIDARGLIAMPPGGDASTPSRIETDLPGAQARIEMGSLDAKRDGINALARDTGGFLVINTNDLNLGLQRVLDDNETYYVLAYEPPESRRDGRFHKIEVRIADRPELKARTRKGYLAPTPEKPPEKSAEKQREKSPEKVAQEAKATKDAQIKSGLASLFPLREIPIEISVEFIDIAGRGPSALINAHIDASALELQRTNDLLTDTIDLTVAVFDERGKVAHSHSERLSLNLKASVLETIVKKGFSYRRHISLKPGFYQARIALREEGTARLGSAASWVEIPDLSKKQLTLSSILLSPGEDEQSLQNANETNLSYQPRPSTARRKFQRGGKVDFLVFAYNAKVEKGSPDVVIQSQVYSGSKLIYASPLAKMALIPDADAQRLPYAARVSLEGFDAGE